RALHLQEVRPAPHAEQGAGCYDGQVTPRLSALLALALLGACLPHKAMAEAPCGEALLPARGGLAIAQKAKQPSRAAVEKARAAWAAVPPACRSGGWYALAGALLRHPGGGREPLVDGTTRFATVKEALEAGLKAAPKDPELLAYVAY